MISICFIFSYETSNGIAAEAQGTLKELEKGVAAVVRFIFIHLFMLNSSTAMFRGSTL